MTSEDVRSELDEHPFLPFRLHLVSGKTVDVPTAAAGYMLQNAILVLHDPRAGVEAGYNVVALRNSEMLEQLPVTSDHGGPSQIGD